MEDGRSRAKRALRRLLPLALLAIPVAAYAATISVPNTFVNGTTADANEVNQNFDTLVVESNAQDVRITTLESTDITAVNAGAGLSGGGTSGAVELAHADTSSQGSVDNSSAFVIQDVTLDTYGHVTGLASANLDGRFVNVVGDVMSGDLRAPRFVDSNNTAFFVDPAGSSVLNTVSKSAGSFEIPHPDPSRAEGGWRLRHSFVESPTRGDNLYRFTVSVEEGVARQKLPDYFSHLNENAQVWVSPVEHFGSAFGTLDDGYETLTIRANADGAYNVLVVGTRKDESAVAFWDAKGAEYRPVELLSAR